MSGAVKIAFTWEQLSAMNTEQFDKAAYQVAKAALAVSLARLERMERPVTNEAVIAMAAHQVAMLLEAAEDVKNSKKKGP